MSVYDLGAMDATNLLSLASHNPALLRGWAQRMVAGVPSSSRDELDLAGKLPLCLKAFKLLGHKSPCEKIIAEHEFKGTSIIGKQ